jgi:tripartite-type tricarboxylate transporter receptor subunit TctC
MIPRCQHGTAQDRATESAMDKKQVNAAISTVVALAFAAEACGAYPSRPVRLIVGAGPGSAGDVPARVVAAHLSELWGQQMVVDNRPGAGLTIAAEIASKATPDGYTLLLCGIALTISPALYRNLSYDITRDFAPVSLLGTTPNVLVVHPTVPAKTVNEFVSYAKAKPGKVNYASSGVGTTLHLSMELFRSMTGINVVHVPYKTVGLAAADLTSGQIDAMIDNLPAQLGAIKAGGVRALGVTTLTRAAQLPSIPTIAESSVPGFDVKVWLGVCAPAAVPKPIIGKLNSDISKVLASPDVRRTLTDRGIEAQSSTPEELAALLKTELARWAKAVHDSGAKAD